MKKSILKLLAVLISLAPASIFGQSAFTLTPTGFVNSQDNGLDYVVLNFPGKKKEDLFKATLLFANKEYVNPKNVVSTVPQESITLNAVAPGAIRRNSMHIFDMNYTITIEFKDEKIKVSAPHFKLTSYGAGHEQILMIVANNAFDGSVLGIWNEKGKLKSEKAKTDLEDYFAQYLVKLTSSINSKSDW